MRGAYYNEFDPYAAEWLRNLMRAGLILAGDVDERSITEVQPEDLNGFTQIHLFAGIGGWPLALRLAGWPDDRPIWTGSCPCQSFSCAGTGKGKKDKRHLWPEMYRLARVHRPAKIIGEQVEDAIGHEWLDGVFIDLEREDYACGAAILPAACRKAPHRRHRIFWMADASIAEFGRGIESGGEHGRVLHSANGGGVDDVADGDGTGHQGERRGSLPTKANRGRARPQHFADDCAFGSVGQPGISGLLSGSDGGTAGGYGNSIISAGCRPHNAVALGDGIGTGLERHGGNGDDRDEPRRLDTLATGPTASASQSGFWDEFILLPCSDGKHRRASAERGVFPLAHGIPSKRKDARLGYLLARLGELGFDSKSARRIIAAAKGNRVGRLKGYGNAIVPEVAAEFIRACMEVTA